MSQERKISPAPYNQTMQMTLGGEADRLSAQHHADPVNEFTQCTLCCPSGLACVCSSVFPCMWLGACSSVRVKEEVVLLNYGKYVTTVREPGCYCWNPAGTEARHVPTSAVALNLDNVKVADGKGNPLILSGVVTYQIVEAKQAIFGVENIRSFLLNQGLTVMKKMAALYPYESNDGHNLKAEADRIREQMIHMMQDRCNVAGVCIYNFELTDLAYAPEVAQQMLIRQQAEAMVDARKIIVTGAVEIASGAVDGLRNKGIKFDEAEQTRLVSNLLVTICGESKVQPTIALNDQVPRHHNG